ncbi:hypothetical protein ACROYT_G036411 [Oculina patagonica]
MVAEREKLWGLLEVQAQQNVQPKCIIFYTDHLSRPTQAYTNTHPVSLGGYAEEAYIKTPPAPGLDLLHVTVAVHTLRTLEKSSWLSIESVSIALKRSSWNKAFQMAMFNSASGLRIKGAEWGSHVKIDFTADTDTSALTYTIDNDSLMDHTAVRLLNASEKIQKIWVYKKPLSSKQRAQWLLNHQFVVLQTAKWYWSVEKTGEQILIQRGENISSVRDNKQKKPRINPIEKMSYDEGNGKSMKDLIEFLYRKNELNKTYHWIGDNCKDFAQRVFDEFAVAKKHRTIRGGRKEGRKEEGSLKHNI